MINLEQIKADIAARKAMPAWGPQTSIERIKTINATLPSFSLKTVEALVEVLDKTQSANAAQNDHINQQQDRIDQLEKKNAELGKYAKELESRTVKLSQPISVLHRRDFIDSHRAIYAYPEAEVNAALARAGIKLEAE
ncbi:hypothetical protein EDF73_11335 [Raoultella sp. BIGb0138]|uniref:ead/Ea22-like family protein n=1 Tax=Raoultella sp. BIGb0138 TaxID=2485115 RepID=UPI0010E25847|nr:ead/Ea22-like family protein [Raoultella sp. BIGb0138]TCW06978.1 hypothetical protein EDF73_11335 [Raoultella sp. BIGb0138]